MKSASQPARSALHASLLKVSDCTCLRLRKTARRLTQVYDGALAPTGLTVTQFGILANLAGHGDLAMGRLAEIMAMDPTSLNRTLKPLKRERLISEKINPEDRRSRVITIAEKGLSLLPAAIKLWESVQHKVTSQLGVEAMRVLNRHLDLAFSQKS